MTVALAILPSRQNFMHDLARFNACQAKIETLGSECKSLVIDAKQVKNGGVKVADMNRVVCCVVAEVIGRSVTEPGFDTTTGHPHGKATWMMIASSFWTIPLSLACYAPTEFSAPNDESVVEHAASLEIHDECGTGLIGIAAPGGAPRSKSTMMIPIWMEQLYKANAAFG
jgi:hypothetical protein